jgi:hypothetical protein
MLVRLQAGQHHACGRTLRRQEPGELIHLDANKLGRINGLGDQLRRPGGILPLRGDSSSRCSASVPRGSMARMRSYRDRACPRCPS